MPDHPDFEFFFDLSSPWTYFAFTRAIPMAEELGITVSWRPILVGGVFNAVNQQVYGARAAMFSDDENRRKLDYFLKDLSDWARLCGVKAVWPEGHPISAVKAMRGAFFAEEQGLLLPYCRAVFAAYWGGENPDISSEAVLTDICRQTGLDPAAFLAATRDQRYKDRLRANTDELIERGGFGSPTMFINRDDMYFGNDRLPLVEFRLRQLLGR